jgi:uncharacterized protein
MVNIKKGDGTFFVEEGGATVAEIHFVSSGESDLVADHTYVSEELQGQGIGEALVKRMVEFTREEGKKLIPSCPFVKAQIDRHKEYQDILA